MASRAFLLQMANVRKGNTADLPEKKKQEFAQSTVTNFRKKMMQAIQEENKIEVDKGVNSNDVLKSS